MGIRPRRDGEPHRPGGCGAPHRMAARIASAIRPTVFRGEGEPSPAALRAASAPGGLSPQPDRDPPENGSRSADRQVERPVFGRFAGASTRLFHIWPEFGLETGKSRSVFRLGECAPFPRCGLRPVQGERAVSNRCSAAAREPRRPFRGFRVGTDGGRRRPGSAVLGDHHPGTEPGGRRQQSCSGSRFPGLPRRVEENDCELRPRGIEPAEFRRGVPGPQAKRFDAEARGVPLDDARHPAALLDEHAAPGAAGERLEAQRPHPRAHIEDCRTRQFVGEHLEKALPQPRRRRPESLRNHLRAPSGPARRAEESAPGEHAARDPDAHPDPLPRAVPQQPVDKAPRMGIRPRRDGEPHRPGGCGALSPQDGGPYRLRDPFRPLSRGGRTLPAPLPGGASRRVGARGIFSTACQPSLSRHRNPFREEIPHR